MDASSLNHHICQKGGVTVNLILAMPGDQFPSLVE
jgi:hypothetical protein